jgi:threonine/homoserine/homoserine lactone efflux protein
MPIYLLIEGMLIGLVVAVPVGPLGLLCINRALMMGAVCGLFSGLGVATADALAAGIVGLGISLISGFVAEQQHWLRLIGGIFLCYLGYKIYRTEPVAKKQINNVNGLVSAYFTTFLLTISNPVTLFSFIAIYAAGVFTGSALWWIGLFIGLTTFHDKFSLRFLFWVHRVSGAVITVFGFVVLLSLTPLRKIFGIDS